jgi:hypothetical protein
VIVYLEMPEDAPFVDYRVVAPENCMFCGVSTGGFAHTYYVWWVCSAMPQQFSH